jgi:hypothetical protein
LIEDENVIAIIGDHVGGNYELTSIVNA